MAVKKTNKRLMITLSKAQADWLTKNAKRMNISVSKFVKFLIDKNTAQMIEILYIKGLKIKDLEEQINIAKTPWITKDED